MWSNMWQVPTVEGHRPLSMIQIKAALRVPMSNLIKRSTFEHHTTHRRIKFHVFSATSAARTGVWRRLNNLADLPMSNAQRRVLAELGS
jgi:adenine-specific DNA glycosylase